MNDTITKERYDELVDKQDFVNQVSLAFESRVGRRYTSVEEISYDFFMTSEGWLCEYVVVRYFGGAIAVTNCAGNSLSAIFRAIGKLLDGGYYDEVKSYKFMKSLEIPLKVEGYVADKVLTPILSRDTTKPAGTVYASCMKCGCDLAEGSNDQEVYQKAPQVCPKCGQILKPEEEE